ncbi:MAG: hypothetical protein IIW72_05440, partial [Clostridia bacterium]|nr:hypothetical protein [Clostridia bacterium]
DNVTYTEDPGFVDYENDNFNIRQDSKIYQDVPNFVAPDFSNMRLKTELLNREAKLGMFGGIEAVSPRNGKKAEVGKNQVEFKWTDLFMATDYLFEIATDKDFKDIVKSEKINKEHITVDLPEAGKTYYWRVTAYTSAVSIDQTPLQSDVFTFTNMTDEEMQKYIRPDYGFLSSKIDIATTMINEKDEMGYGDAEIKALKKVRDEAVEFVKGYHTFEEIEEMKAKIVPAIIDAKKSEAYSYIDLDLNADSWNLTGAMTAENNAEGELVLTPVSGNPHAISINNTSYGKMYRFQMLTEDHQDWWGITPTYALDVKDRYFFVPNVAQIECQKVLAGTRLGFLQIVENDSYIKPGVWQEVEVGNVVCDEGIWVFLRIDGREVINAIDTENVLENDGGFQFLLNSRNGYVKVRPSKLKDSNLPVKPTKK